MKSSRLFECEPLPAYIHLASTRCHSRDRCSQTFPFFATFLLPCIILSATQRTKMGEAWEQNYSHTTCVLSFALSLNLIWHLFCAMKTQSQSCTILQDKPQGHKCHELSPCSVFRGSKNGNSSICSDMLWLI